MAQPWHIGASGQNTDHVHTWSRPSTLHVRVFILRAISLLAGIVGEA